MSFLNFTKILTNGATTIDAVNYIIDSIYFHPDRNRIYTKRKKYNSEISYKCACKTMPWQRVIAILQDCNVFRIYFEL